MIERVPPHDLEAERAVIGSILTDAALMPKAAPQVIRALAMLRPGDFYRSAHAEAYRAAGELHESGVRPDLPAVIERLESPDESALALCAESVSNPSNVEHFARIVLRHSRSRAVIAACSEAMQAAYAGDDGAADILRSGLESFDQGAEQATGYIADLIEQAFSDLISEVDLVSGQGGNLGWRIAELDTKGAHIRPGDFPIIAARPGKGKSMFVLGWAIQTAMSTERPVVYASIEMPGAEQARRALCNIAGTEDPQTAKADAEAERAFRDAMDFVKQGHVPLYMPDNVPNQLDAFCRWARGVIYRQSPAALVVDYLGCLQGQGKSLYEKVTGISKAVRAVAKDTGCPVIGIHQMNREVEKESRWPRMSDLRDAGQLEQDATHIGFLHTAHKAINDKRTGLPWIETGDLVLVWCKSRGGRSEQLIRMSAEYAKSRIVPAGRAWVGRA